MDIHQELSSASFLDARAGAWELNEQMPAGV